MLISILLFVTDGEAENTLDALWCAAVHEGADPCADWIAPEINTPELCHALIETDIGYSFRKRPTPNFARSEEYYDNALESAVTFFNAILKNLPR